MSIAVDDLLSDVAAPSDLPIHADLGAPGPDPRQTRRRGSAWRRYARVAAVCAVVVAAASGAWFWRADIGRAVPIASDITTSPYNTTLVKPPVGEGLLLSRAEIRYCLAEALRLRAARTQVDATALDVGRLNASVTDLNARCGSYQYQGDDLALATADVQLRSDEISAAGRRAYLLAADASVTAAPTSSKPAGATATEAAPAEPRPVSSPPDEKLVRDTQWLLFKLGYYNGSMSGEASRSTRAARQQFMRDRGLDADSDWASVLSVLLEVSQQEAPGTAGTAAVEGTAPLPESRLESASNSETPTAAALAVVQLPDVGGLPDVDRLAIDALCGADAGKADYAACVGTELARLDAVPRVDISRLPDAERLALLATCGPLRDRAGPSAYYRCLSSEVNAAEPTPPAVPDATLPNNVVSAIESRCAGAAGGDAGEYARCVGGQFANLAEPMTPVFLTALEFSERESIERVCAGRVGGITEYYVCVRTEVDALRAFGAKPDMRVASFEHRKDIEAVCRQNRLTRGPATYYQCLSVQLQERGYRVD
ncbi:MAG: hypothetical protein AAGA11_03815 [Pseudomonadota bacterium]